MRRAGALASLPLCAVLGAASPAPADGVTLTVTATELRNAKGVVLACLTSHKDLFPKCRGVAGARATKAAAREGRVTLTFTDVPAGHYAIALLHDENANGKADRALGMMPKEGFGFSRDAPVKMGPPAFEDAAFDLGNQSRSLTIRMRYML